MLSHRAQLSEEFIGLLPVFELPFGGFDYFFQRGEITIVEAKPPRQFPDPLDRIQIRAIGRQETQFELRLLLRLVNDNYSCRP
jgi:hypothetical protein